MFCLSTRKYFFNILLARTLLVIGSMPLENLPYRISTKKKSEFYYYDAPERPLQALVTLFTPCSHRSARAAGKNLRPKTKRRSLHVQKRLYILIPAMLPACKTFLLNSIFTTLVKHFSDISTNKVTCCFANTGCLMRPSWRMRACTFRLYTKTSIKCVCTICFISVFPFGSLFPLPHNHAKRCMGVKVWVHVET